MGVNEEIVEAINPENVIPKRLENMLRLQGIKIHSHNVINVGGGGKCGAYFVSIHTTGSEESATEIRININRHIMENWEIYKDCFEYPHTARIGGGTKIFKNEEDLLIFLMEEVEEAAKMWMTHVFMQAAATMLNIKINILTTGISPTQIYKCARCQPEQEFVSENDLIEHTENVHQRLETEEEKEGRLQNSRWTRLIPVFLVTSSTGKYILYIQLPEPSGTLHNNF